MANFGLGLEYVDEHLDVLADSLEPFLVDPTLLVEDHRPELGGVQPSQDQGRVLVVV